jgi:hypothetical protein
MRQYLRVGAVGLVSLALASTAIAGPGGSHSSQGTPKNGGGSYHPMNQGSGVHPNKNFYAMNHGKPFSHGFFYPGKEHHHWTYYCWWDKYHCNCYWCPYTCCWYYWCPSAVCYYPVSYVNIAPPTVGFTAAQSVTPPPPLVGASSPVAVTASSTATAAVGAGNTAPGFMPPAQ